MDISTTAASEIWPVPSSTERYIEATVLSLLCVISLVGNISLWVIILTDRSLRTTSNWLILGLSGADILVSSVNMPVTVVTLVSGHWMLSTVACVGFGFVTMLTFIASVMSLGVLSFNRYVLICHNSKFGVIYTKGRTLLMICGESLLPPSVHFFLRFFLSLFPSFFLHYL